MNIFKRIINKRRAKQNIAKYHQGCRDTMQIADVEKNELCKTYEMKINDKVREIARKDAEILTLKNALIEVQQLQHKDEERYMNLDSALALIARSAEIQKTIQANRYKQVMSDVELARHRIRRVLKKLPKTQSKIDNIVNKVV